MSEYKKYLDNLWESVTIENDLKNKMRKYDNFEDFLNSLDLLYHGTDQKFDKFSLKYFGQTDYGFAGIGHYFSSVKKYAKEFGKNLMRVYVDLKNPYIYNDSFLLGSVSPDNFKKSLGLSLKSSSRDIRNELLKNNYDGVIVNKINENGKIEIPKIEVVAMGNKQIKTIKDLENIWMNK